MFYPQEDLWRGSVEVHNFVLAQLQLLSMLCQGKNDQFIQVLQGDAAAKSIGMKMTFHTIMTALHDKHLMRTQPRLRAKLLELIIGDIITLNVYIFYIIIIPNSL